MRDDEFVEVVKLAGRRQTSRRGSTGDEKTDLLWGDDAVHQREPLQVFPGAHAHSMHIDLPAQYISLRRAHETLRADSRHLVQDTLGRPLPVGLVQLGIREDDVVHELAHRLLQPPMALSRVHAVSPSALPSEQAAAHAPLCSTGCSTPPQAMTAQRTGPG